MLARLEEDHPQDLRVVFRHFPLLSIHDKASLAGQAAEAAGAQGAFWPMHDILFDRYQEWVNLSPEAFRDWLMSVADELQLDAAAFQADLDGGTFAGRMEQAFRGGLASGLPGTPFLFLNGRAFRAAPSHVNLEAALRLELLRPRQFASYPPVVISTEEPLLAVIRLRRGQLHIQLFPQSAPLAVNSFVYLANQGWFDGSPLYRVDPGVLVEAGDPTGTGLGVPGYHFATELDAALRFDRPGTVALVSSGPDTNDARFFITLAPLPQLDGTRTIFGRVIEGLDRLYELGAREPLEDLLTPPEEVILSVEIEGP